MDPQTFRLMFALRWLLVAAAFLVPASTLSAQTSASDPIYVMLEVSAPTSTVEGIFRSNFAASLRNLGDVHLIERRERADYVLSVTVLCTGGRSENDKCLRATGYSTAILFYSPMRQEDALLMQSTSQTEPVASVPTLDPLVWSVLKDYDKNHNLDVTNWGTLAYEQAIREYVAELDSNCFDKKRYVSRLVNTMTRPDSADFVRFMSRREWIC